MDKVRKIVFDGNTYYAVKDLIGEVEINDKSRKLIHTLSIGDETIECADKNGILKIANNKDRERLKAWFDKDLSDFNKKLKKGLNFNPKK